jgi:hypothetical protein
MQIIDAINEMIGWLGETPVSTDDPDYESHPLYESALRILQSTSRTVQSKGWWFNTREATLTPVSNAITLAANVLAVAVKDIYRVQYTVRAGALYDLTNGTATITSALQAFIRELVDFEDLPETAAEYIKQTAAERFAATYDADEAKLRRIKEARGQAFVLFNAEDIRQAKVNMFRNASMARYMANTWHTRYIVR